MSELYDRLARYRQEGLRHLEWEKEQFRQALEIDDFPPKCWVCFSAGLRYCRYWTTGHNCEEYEIGVGEEIVKRFK